MRTALVIGAGGTLGARVTDLLRRELPQLRVVPASRSGPARLGVGARRVDVRDPASLRAVLEGGELVVNAVGPYAYDPGPLVGACIATGAHYADLAESPAFLEAVRNAASEARDVTVVPGCSTVPGLLDLVVRHLGGGPAEAWLSLGSRNRVSPGLLFGLLRPLGRPAPEGGVFFGGVTHRTLSGRRLRFGTHPSALEGVRLRVGFDRALLVHALRATAPALARLPDASLRSVARVMAPLAGLARPFGTPRGLLRVETRAGAVEIEAAQDGLDVPAAPIVWLATRLADGRAEPGVRTLAEVVPPEDVFRWLRTAGYAVREERA